MPDIVKVAVKQQGLALHYANAKLKDNPEIVKAAVQQNYKALECASERLKNDPDIVLCAVEQNVAALRYVGNMKNKDLLLKALKQDPKACWYLKKELFMDAEFAEKVKTLGGKAAFYFNIAKQHFEQR